MTTTTTTLPPPLAIVQTTEFGIVNDKLVPIQTSNASDSSTTQNSLLAQSLSFGTIAPNQTSKTIIIQLNVPYVKAITNIKIGLVATGGVEFANNLFGVTSSIELRDDITPDNHFQGVNTNRDPASLYNIGVPNKDNYTSEYVYLNVQLPIDQVIGEGICRFKWFFDFAE
jgi:hypothetical protein